MLCAGLLAGACREPEGGGAAAPPRLGAQADPSAQKLEGARTRLQSRDRETRRRAILDLAAIGSHEALQILLGVLSEERDPELRGMALEAVRSWRDPQSFEHLEIALRAPESEVRARAAARLGEMRDRRALPALRRALETEPDARVRAALRSALVRIEGES